MKSREKRTTSRTARLEAGSVSQPVEFSVEDAVLNTWAEDTGMYLRLDIAQARLDDLAPARPES